MFKQVIFESKAVSRYMELERLTEDGILELYFNCYCSYMEMMKERIKCGRELNRILAAYKHIDAFRQASPRQLFQVMFNAPALHRWFAYQFRAAIDKQIINNHTDKDELWVSLTFTHIIPTAKTMEDILNGTTKSIGALQTVTGEKETAGTASGRVKHANKQSV